MEAILISSNPAQEVWDTTLTVLARSTVDREYKEIQKQWRIITKEKKVDIVVLDMPLLDTRKEKNLLGTFISDIVLQLLSFVAENERVNIRQRQSEGISAAKKRGVRFGRPVKEILNFEEIAKKWDKKELSINDISANYNISEATFYRRLREYKVLKISKSS